MPRNWNARAPSCISFLKNNMKENWIKPFITSAGVILLVSALTRFLISVNGAAALSLPEPMMSIPIHYAVLIVGSIELAVALLCLFGRDIKFQIGCLGWLMTNYIIYRIALFCMRCHVQATWIGSLTDPLHLSRGYMGYIMQFLPFCLLLGSYGAALQLWLESSTRTKNQVLQSVVMEPDTKKGAPVLVRFQKISCSACGGHIEYPTNLLGEKIPCPHCQTMIVLQRPGNVKMSCPACDGHIEFPLHGVGQTIACPHCTTPVTLLTNH
jgi:hypothetical protein